MPEALVPLNPDDIAWTAIRAQGAGGQNVNKVSSAIHLRYDILAASLPEAVRQRLLALNDQRITAEGVLVIKAQTARSQEQNRLDAIARLQALVDSVALPPKPRKATKPTKAAQHKRLEHKSTRGDVKKLRTRVETSE